MTGFWLASYIALWVVIGLLAFVVMGLLRQFGLLQMRMGIEPGVLITGEGLERGVEAPEFEALDVVSTRVFRSSELRGRRAVLVFLTPTCGECREVAKQLSDVANQWREIQFLGVCYGSEQACEELAAQSSLRVPLLRDLENSISSAYGVRSTPFAYLIDEEGRILMRGVVNTWPQLQALIEERGTLRSGIALDEVIGRETVQAVAGEHRQRTTARDLSSKGMSPPEVLSSQRGNKHEG